MLSFTEASSLLSGLQAMLLMPSFGLALLVGGRFDNTSLGSGRTRYLARKSHLEGCCCCRRTPNPAGLNIFNTHIPVSAVAANTWYVASLDADRGTSATKFEPKQWQPLACVAIPLEKDEHQADLHAALLLAAAS
jgi:hypothetical protein